MSKVIENLKEAIQGESEAQYKYRLFSEKAEEEKHPAVAHLFQAVAYAEGRHIKNHLRALKVLTGKEVTLEEVVELNEDEIKEKINDTLSNLQNAIDGETYETKKMYKKFEKNASSAGESVPELSFSLARDAEEIHAKLFSQYLKNLKKGKKIQEKKIFVCTICGNVEFMEAPEVCPVCDHSKQFFKEIKYQ
ncbi:MAG: rubrerythrin family protein [Promethearchaeota archaeon]|nr:MAG: rubrerythrin family protein [Candidatus Lokiarchaeota archaeon]